LAHLSDQSQGFLRARALYLNAHSSITVNPALEL
jgi:hypothetical protein